MAEIMEIFISFLDITWSEFVERDEACHTQPTPNRKTFIEESVEAVHAFIMNGDGNPIVKARCAAVDILSCCEKETFVTGLLYQEAYEDLSNPTYLIPATSVLTLASRPSRGSSFISFISSALVNEIGAT